ncbi:MAG TPA: oxygenase MpaB family protein [Acidimicrobiales bacterium]|nr:oxygenase MpaB family protein [Acidimicrobiales bacterium]
MSQPAGQSADVSRLDPTTGRRELGPDSLLWRWAGDSRIAFLGGTIGLLQLMHPAIGAGVMEHSDFFGDPYGRVFRSLPRILGAVYDGPAAAATGREVRDFHRDIKGVDATGRRYHALDPATFWWAHATFQFMAEQVGDRFDVHRITPAERDELYLDGVEWYRRYGVSDRAVPPTRAAFQVAWDDICTNVLEMNPAAAFVLELLEHIEPPRLTGVLRPFSGLLALPPWRRLATVPLRIAAIGGLPAVVRERFGLPWSRQDQLQLSALELVVAQAWPFVPPSVRWQPRALEGWRRVRRERHGRPARAAA